MNVKDEILKLKDGESWIWPESDYGKAEIWRKHEMFFLFAIPIFGGLPVFAGQFSINRLDNLIKKVDSWR